MSFLNALSGFGKGFGQGLDQSSQIAMRAQQIQAAQMALDQEKRSLAANAAAFQGLLQNGGQGQVGQQLPPATGAMPPGVQPAPQTGQPPMPGQSSVPMNTPMPQAPQTYPRGMVAPPVQGLGVTTGPQMGTGGPPASGAPQVGQQVQPPSSGLASDLSLQGQLGIISIIAQRIKAANPGMDPETLFDATKAQIGLLGGLSSAQRSDLALLMEQMKEQHLTELQAQKASDASDLARQKDADAAERERIKGDYMLQGRQMSANAAMNRAQFIQGALDKRFKAGQFTTAQKAAGTERVRALQAQLTQATRELTSLKNAAGMPLPDSDPRVQKAKARIADANRKLGIVAETYKIDVPNMGENEGESPAGGAAPGGNVVDFNSLPK